MVFTVLRFTALRWGLRSGRQVTFFSGSAGSYLLVEVGTKGVHTYQGACIIGAVSRQGFNRRRELLI